MKLRYQTSAWVGEADPRPAAEGMGDTRRTGGKRAGGGRGKVEAGRVYLSAPTLSLSLPILSFPSLSTLSLCLCLRSVSPFRSLPLHRRSVPFPLPLPRPLPFPLPLSRLTLLPHLLPLPPLRPSLLHSPSPAPAPTFSQSVEEGHQCQQQTGETEAAASVAAIAMAAAAARYSCSNYGLVFRRYPVLFIHLVPRNQRPAQRASPGAGVGRRPRPRGEILALLLASCPPAACSAARLSSLAVQAARAITIEGEDEEKGVETEGRGKGKEDRKREREREEGGQGKEG